MRAANDNSYLTVFDLTMGHKVSTSRRPMTSPGRGYRALVGATLALAVIGLTTAAGAWSRSSHHVDAAGQTSYSHINLPTLGTFEGALY